MIFILAGNYLNQKLQNYYKATPSVVLFLNLFHNKTEVTK